MSKPTRLMDERRRQELRTALRARPMWLRPIDPEPIRGLTDDAIWTELRQLVEFAAREWSADDAAGERIARDIFVQHAAPYVNEMNRRIQYGIVVSAAARHHA